MRVTPVANIQVKIQQERGLIDCQSFFPHVVCTDAYRYWQVILFFQTTINQNKAAIRHNVEGTNVLHDQSPNVAMPITLLDY